MELSLGFLSVQHFGSWSLVIIQVSGQIRRRASKAWASTHEADTKAMCTCWVAIMLVLVFSGRAFASGRNLTDMTAAAPESSISRPATSANSTATAIESVPVPGSTVQPLCNYGCDVYSRSSLGAAAVGSNWYFAACSASDCPNNKGIQYYCCAQTCKVDSDCPLFYFCPDGMSDDSYCTKCSSCSQTENAKCQTDQSCPSLPPPSPPQPVVSAIISSADVVPMVTSFHKLQGFSVATFDAAAQSTFLSTLEGNILKISGPVKVFIPSGGITDGSVNVQLSVVFLNGEEESAKAYKNALTGSSASSVYGSYDAYVDRATFDTETTANPSHGSSAAVGHTMGAVAAFSMALSVLVYS